MLSFSTVLGVGADVVGTMLEVGAVFGVGASLWVGTIVRIGATAIIGAKDAVGARATGKSASGGFLCFFSAVVEEVIFVLTFNSTLEHWASFGAVDWMVPEEPGIS